jgi:hypothetical protein
MTTAEIAAVFGDEIGSARGTVRETADDGERLFIRAVLPRTCEVRPRDALQAGVAVKATDTDVWVHPFVFRLACKNGAIMAHAAESRHLFGHDEGLAFYLRFY